MIKCVPDLAPALRKLPAGKRLLRLRFDFLGLPAEVASNDREALSLFLSLYRAFRARSGRGGKPSSRVGKTRGKGIRLRLLREGTGRRARYLSIDPGFPSFISPDHHRAVAFLSAQLFVNHLYRRSILFFHAAAFLRGGQAFVFCGGSRSGKSTLAMKLRRAGFRLLSDEFAPLDLRTGRILPFPRSLLLREDRFFSPARARRGETVFLDYQEPGRDGRPSRRRLVAWPAPPPVRSAAPGAFFVLRGFASGGTKIRALGAPRAARLLLAHCVNTGYVRARTKTRPIETRARLLSAAPAFVLSPGGRGETAERLAAAVDR
ncbi:MAG: hypothetical protein NTV79_05535, partial [Candidatus Aureabacteria bacterium]|nr:hypothetical protein [Candidatus Auribacterota bacterium]